MMRRVHSSAWATQSAHAGAAAVGPCGIIPPLLVFATRINRRRML